MKLSLIIISIFLAVNVTLGQPEIEWQRLYGGDGTQEFSAHIRTAAGGWAFVGNDNRQRPQNFWLVVTELDGNLVFEETYGDENYNYAWDLVQTEDNGFLIGGGSHDETYDFYVIRVDAWGDVVWQMTYGDFAEDLCYAVLAIKDDQFILAGKAVTDAESRQAYLVKIDGDGEVIWERTYGGEGIEEFQDIIGVENGYAMAGVTTGNNDVSGDFWLVRVNLEGEEIWTQTYGDEISEKAMALIRTEEDGGYALCGYETPGGQGLHTVVVKTNQEGEQQWLNRYMNEEVWTLLFDIARMPNGGYAAVGTGRSHLGYTLALDDAGNIMWERLDQVEPGISSFRSVLLDDDNGITMAGKADILDESVNNQGWFVKLAPADRPPMILNKIPSDSLFRIPRGGSQMFTVEAVDPELGELTYTWVFEGDTISEEEMIILEFPEYDTLGLMTYISDLTWTVSTGWQIIVVPLISGWSPIDSVLQIDRGDMVRFYVQAGLPEDTTLTYLWRLDEEAVSDADSAWIPFHEVGQFDVTVDVAARDVEESHGWHVTVIEPEFVGSRISRPSTYHLGSPYPNPFNAITSLDYNLPAAGRVNIQVYNVAGQLVETLVDGVQSVGEHTAIWNAKAVSSGVYIVQVEAAEFTANRKVVLVR